MCQVSVVLPQFREDIYRKKKTQWTHISSHFKLTYPPSPSIFQCCIPSVLFHRLRLSVRPVYFRRICGEECGARGSRIPPLGKYKLQIQSLKRASGFHRKEACRWVAKIHFRTRLALIRYQDQICPLHGLSRLVANAFSFGHGVLLVLR